MKLSAFEIADLKRRAKEGQIFSCDTINELIADLEEAKAVVQHECDCMEAAKEKIVGLEAALHHEQEEAYVAYKKIKRLTSQLDHMHYLAKELCECRLSPSKFMEAAVTWKKSNETNTPI